MPKQFFTRWNFAWSLMMLPVGIFCCNNAQKENSSPTKTKVASIQPQQKIVLPNQKTIHILVALCDNKYQGIVPVPAKIGNGQDPANNLYWGCAYGIKTYFTRSGNWTLVKKYAIDSIKLERLLFKHKKTGVYLVADAYNGKFIRNCTIDFLKSCAGTIADSIQVQGQHIGINGNAKLLGYIGHDGLMDFDLPATYKNEDGLSRDAIILACYSKRFFQSHLQQTGASPLLWSTGLMSPEAYTLHDALESYLAGGSSETVRSSAAAAYSKYQRCSMKAAINLLVTGH
jgi:hypothetical protein